MPLCKLEKDTLPSATFFESQHINPSNHKQSGFGTAGMGADGPSTYVRGPGHGLHVTMGRMEEGK